MDKKVSKMSSVDEITREALLLLKEHPERVEALGKAIELRFPGEMAAIVDKIDKQMAAD